MVMACYQIFAASTGEEMLGKEFGLTAFQDKGGWYIENSLTTLNQKIPVSEENTRLWNTGVDSDKEIGKKKESYHATQTSLLCRTWHPENEGKVFLFKFGKKIFDKITEAMQAAFDDDIPINI